MKTRKLIGFLLGVPHAFVRGWVIKLTWLWFVVPATGLKPISAAVAYGLAVFMTTWTLSAADIYAYEAAYEKDKINVIAYPLAAMLLLALTVGIGWVVKTYFL